MQAHLYVRSWIIDKLTWTQWKWRSPIRHWFRIVITIALPTELFCTWDRSRELGLRPVVVLASSTNWFPMMLPKSSFVTYVGIVKCSCALKCTSVSIYPIARCSPALICCILLEIFLSQLRNIWDSKELFRSSTLIFDLRERIDLDLWSMWSRM